MGEQDVVAEFVGAFFNGKDDARENGIGDGGDDQAEELGGAGAQALGLGIGHVTHLLREQLDARLGGRGNIRLVPQRLRDGHHGNAGMLGNVFERTMFS